MGARWRHRWRHPGDDLGHDFEGRESPLRGRAIHQFCQPPAQALAGEWAVLDFGSSCAGNWFEAHLYVEEALIEIRTGRCCHQVACVYKTNNLGGLRRWLACPDCQRACRAIYVDGGRVSCRKCLGLRYASQLEPAHYRCYRRAEAIWGRVAERSPDADHDFPNFPGKPCGMHWATWLYLHREYDALRSRGLLQGAAALGIL